ncbi:MAG: hypothetical protein K8M05_20890 [Deltaproteobacteria bacterium]|nr:hypothetical protein [Kofleriaceae bacterium]
MGLDHDALVALALERAPDDVLRKVFDVSRRLGASFRAYHHLDLPLNDLCDVLPRLGVPCAARSWTRVTGEAACRGERAGCRDAALHPRACAFWREAIDGLVLGMTSAVLFARHASRGAGDASCVDVLHVHPQSPSRFGPIPAHVRDELERIGRTARALDPSLAVTFLGISEGVLYYRAERDAAGDQHASTAIEPAVRRRFPRLALREISPRPVLAEAAI